MIDSGESFYILSFYHLIALSLYYYRISIFIHLKSYQIYDCEGMNEETSVDDVLVVYCALYPDAIEKETYVVGWYKHATVYRNCKVMRFLSDTEEEYYD